MSVGNKRSYILTTCSFQLQVCLSPYDLLLPPGIKGLTFYILNHSCNFESCVVMMRISVQNTVHF